MLAAAVILGADARWRTLSATAMVLAAAGIFASGSRAAMIPLLVTVLAGVGFAAWQRLSGAADSRSRWAPIAAILVLLGGLLVATQIAGRSGGGARMYRPAGSFDALAQTLAERGGLDMGRQQWWGLALDLAREHPATGVGLGRFPCLLDANVEGAHAENAHGYPLQLLAVMGVPGAAAFLLLAVLTTLGVWLHGGHPTPRSSLAAMLYLGFLATHLTGNALLEPTVQACLGVYLGLALSGSRAFGDREPASRSRDGGPTEPTSPPAPGNLEKVGLPLVVVAVLTLALAWGAWGATRAAAGDLPRCRGDWGSTWGLYPTEKLPDGIEFRWTGERAILDLSRLNGPGVTRQTARLVIVAPQAALRAQPVYLWVFSGANLKVLSLVTDAPKDLELIPPVEGPWIVRLLVDGTFVPAELNGSGDSRLLGVRMSITPAASTGREDRQSGSSHVGASTLGLSLGANRDVP